METTGLKSNYIFTLVKFLLFLVIFCFLVEMTKEFSSSITASKGLNREVLLFSLLGPFIFYTFFADLNNLYKNIQNFFFRSTSLALAIPSFLVLCGIGYFILPRVFKFVVDKDTFLFVGGFVLSAHLIFAARETRGNTLIDFINYLFTLSIIYLINLVLFAIYLRITFALNLRDVSTKGIENGALLIKDLLLNIFK